eukprot:scaffold3054_cov129-Cylindrotheca_fusiformis.AAC.11
MSDATLSVGQQKALAILPIPSAVLSIFGSCIIIFVAVRTRKKQSWTPYTRLLVAMSVSDILFSATMAVANFLRPRDTSWRIWAFGNDATCNVVGFMNQLSTAAIFYNGMLSFYFLLTARFGIKNDYVARRIEPVMHFIAICYPLVTATVAAVEGVYGEMSVNALVCWVVRYPKNCGDEPGQERCVSFLVGWLFYGVPVVATLAALVVNNLIIIVSVRKETRAPRGKTQRRNVSSRQRQQSRLKLVRSQATLYVASFVTCIMWSGILNSAETLVESEEEEKEMMAKFFPISVIQAILLPLQGLFNMVVYVRPKYFKVKHDFPKETKTWAIKRAVFGECVKNKHQGTEALSPETPIQAKVPTANRNFNSLRMPDITTDDDDNNDDDAGNVLGHENHGGERSDSSTRDSSNSSSNNASSFATTRLPKDTVSSLTASQEFDDILEEDEVDEIWKDNNREGWERTRNEADERMKDDNREGWEPTRSAPRFRSSLADTLGSSLEVISELSESVFEPINTPKDKPPPPPPLLSPDKSESRWSANYKKRGRQAADEELSAAPLLMPRRRGSESDLSSLNDDSPLTPPRRRPSPHQLVVPVDGTRDREAAVQEAKVDSPVAPPLRRLSPVYLESSEELSSTELNSDT